jgi:hypothetical protein
MNIAGRGTMHLAGKMTLSCGQRVVPLCFAVRTFGLSWTRYRLQLLGLVGQVLPVLVTLSELVFLRRMK